MFSIVRTSRLKELEKRVSALEEDVVTRTTYSQPQGMLFPVYDRFPITLVVSYLLDHLGLKMKKQEYFSSTKLVSNGKIPTL